MSALCGSVCKIRDALYVGLERRRNGVTGLNERSPPRQKDVLCIVIMELVSE